MRLTVKPLKNRSPGNGMAVVDGTRSGASTAVTSWRSRTEAAAGRSPASGPATPPTRAVASSASTASCGATADVDEIELTMAHFESALEEVEPRTGDTTPRDEGLADWV